MHFDEVVRLGHQSKENDIITLFMKDPYSVVASVEDVEANAAWRGSSNTRHGVLSLFPKAPGGTLS